MKIELEETELKTLKLMETGELDIVLQDAIQHFVDESMTGKNLTLTFKIDDWKKVLVYDYGYCEYFGVAKLVSVAKKFGLQSLATFNYKANRFKI